MSGDDSNSSLELSRDILNHSQNAQHIGSTALCNGAANGEPYLEIVMQPKSRGFRFRYACEGKSHGGIQGENSGKNNKSFPTVKINNYTGKARVVVKLVTDESSPRPHAHELIGKNCKEGNCNVEINCAQHNGVVSFPNMGILHVTRKNVTDILKTRIMEEVKVSKVMNDRFHQLDINNIQLTGEEELHAAEQATSQAKDMTLNVVRLCFQAYLADSRGGYSHILPPVYSQAIYDCKSPGAAALKICRMDKHAGCCIGNEEVFLLCDKVQKEDITVRFFEVSANDEITWEAVGNFGPTDVHRQYAIVFRTPQYYNTSIDKPVNVFVQLRRSSDGETSDAKPFTYYPQQKDQDEVLLKKQKTVPCFSGLGSSLFSSVNNGQMQQRGAETIALVTQQVNGVRTIEPRLAPGLQGANTFIIRNSGISDGNGMRTQQPQALFLNPTVNQVAVVPHGLDDVDSSSQPQMQARGLSIAKPLHTKNGNVEMLSRGAPILLRTKKDIILRRGLKGDLEEDSSPITDTVDSGNLCPYSTLDSGVSTLPSASMEPSVESSSPAVAKAAGSVASATMSLETLALGENTEVMNRKTTNKLEVVQQANQKSQEKPVGTNQSGIETGDGDVETKVVREHEDSQETTAEPKKEDTEDDIQELAWRVAENTALAMQEFAKTGNIAYLLLIQRHLVAIQDSNGDNALHMAVIHRKVEPLRSLLCVAATLPENPAINTCNSLQQTPLHLAVLTNQPDMVDVLVSNNADLHLVDRCGNTPTHLAASLGYVGCLQNLLNMPSSRGSSMESRKLLKTLNYDGFTPVHLAVREGHMMCLRHLVMADADVNVSDGKSGYSALHHAVDCENLGIVGYLLLEAAAEPNRPAYNGVSALHVAVGRGSLPIAALLIASGADPEAECSELPAGEVEPGEEGEESESGSQKTAEVKGMTPIDMAQSNAKMLAVLNGDVYTSLTDPQTSEDSTPLYSEILDSGLGLMAQDAGDLDMLDLVTRVKLGRILDHADKESNWQVLAKHFSLDRLCEALSAMKSPTRALLDNLEVLDATISKLKEVLVKMGRTDCIEVIEEGQALNKKAADNLLEKRRKEAESAGGFPGSIPHPQKTPDLGPTEN